MHFSLGLDLTLVCETSQTCYKRDDLQDSTCRGGFSSWLWLPESASYHPKKRGWGDYDF